MAWPLVVGLIGKLVDVYKGRKEHKDKLKAIKQEGEIKIESAVVEAKIRRAETGDEHAGELDKISVKDRGWKDEYLMFLATIPLILAFIPDMVHHVTAGFESLDKLPEWYKWVLLGVYIDTFGFRRILRVAMEKFINAKFG